MSVRFPIHSLIRPATQPPYPPAAAGSALYAATVSHPTALAHEPVPAAQALHGASNQWLARGSVPASSSLPFWPRTHASGTC